MILVKHLQVLFIVFKQNGLEFLFLCLCLISYVECYEKEVLQTTKLTADIVKNKDYVCTLTSSLNDLEMEHSTLVNEYEKYKINMEKKLLLLKNKLNASEEIVKQLASGN